MDQCDVCSSLSTWLHQEVTRNWMAGHTCEGFFFSLLNHFKWQDALLILLFKVLLYIFNPDLLRWKIHFNLGSIFCWQPKSSAGRRDFFSRLPACPGSWALPGIGAPSLGLTLALQRPSSLGLRCTLKTGWNIQPHGLNNSSWPSICRRPLLDYTACELF